MKTIVIYDSLYGNTEQIARAIGGAVGDEVTVAKVAEADAAALASFDLVIIGSPTQGGRFTPKVKAFLDKIPTDALKGRRVAVFDTRAKGIIPKIFGWAANRLADTVQGKGAVVVAPGEGFFVKATKGPLVEGELERAAAWAKTIATK
jgi:flavodoxin I